MATEFQLITNDYHRHPWSFVSARLVAILALLTALWVTLFIATVFIQSWQYLQTRPPGSGALDSSKLIHFFILSCLPAVVFSLVYGWWFLRPWAWWITFLGSGWLSLLHLLQTPWQGLEIGGIPFGLFPPFILLLTIFSFDVCMPNSEQVL